MAGSKKRRAKAAKKQHHNNTNTKQHEVLPSTNKESSVELEEEECLESMADEGEEIVTPKTPGKDAEGDMDMPIKDGAVNENGNVKGNVNASEEDEGSLSPKTPARDTEPEPVNGSMHAEDASSACANEEVLADGNLGAHPEPELPIPAAMDSSTVETDPPSDVNEADADANSVIVNPPINKEESTTCAENEADSLAVAESQNVKSVEVTDNHGMEPEALSVSNDPQTASESSHKPLQEATEAVSDNSPEAFEDMEAPSIPEASPEEAEADPGTQSVNETVPEETVNVEGETVHVTPPADEVNFAEPDATPPPAPVDADQDILATTEAPSTIKPADAETEASVSIETTDVELESSLPADTTNTEPESSLPMKAPDEEPEASLSTEASGADSGASFAIEAADAKPDGLLATEAEAADVESEASFAIEAADAKPDGLLAIEAEAADVEPEGSLPTEAEAADVEPEGSLSTEATDEVPEGSLPTEATDGDIEAPVPARTSDAEEEASLPTDKGGAPLSTDEEGEASPPIKATGVEGEAPHPNEATDAEVEAPSPTEATDAEVEAPSSTEAADAEVDAPPPTEAADAEVDAPPPAEAADAEVDDAPPAEATTTIGESLLTTEGTDAEGEAPLPAEAEIEAPLSTETTDAEAAAAHSIEPSILETEVPAPNVQDSTISENKESDIPSIVPEADVAPVLATEADKMTETVIAEGEGVLSEVCAPVEVRDIDAPLETAKDEYPVAVTGPSAEEEKEGEIEILKSQEVVEKSEVRGMEAESLQPVNVEVVETENPLSVDAVEINEVEDQTLARSNLAEAEKVEPDLPSQGEDSQMAMIEVCEATETELGAPATVEDVPIQDVEPASDGVLESAPESCKLGSHVLVSEQENPLTQVVSSEGVSEPVEHRIKNEEEHNPESNDEQTVTDVPSEEAQQAEVAQQLDSTILGIEETMEITDRSGFTEETVAQEIDAKSDHVSDEGKDVAEQTSVQPEALDSEYDRGQFEVETTLSELEKDIGEEEATSSVAVEVGSVRTDFDDTNIPDEQDLENTHPSEEGGIVFDKEFDNNLADNCPISDRAASDVSDPKNLAEMSNDVAGIHSVALPNGEHVQFLKDSAIATGGGSPEDDECNGEAHSVPNPVEDEQLNGQAHSDDQDAKEINEDQISELGAYSGKWKHAAVIPEEAIGLVYTLEEKSLAPNSSKAVDDLLPASTPVLENGTDKAEVPMAIESTNNIVATDTTGKDVGLVVNNEPPQTFLNQSSQAASKSVTVAVQKDRVVDRDATITASGVTIGRRTNWIFSCCGLLDLLLGRDQ